MLRKVRPLAGGHTANEWGPAPKDVRSDGGRWGGPP